MPFPYPASSASVRTRRTKEKDRDSRGVVSGGSGRKHREVSKSSYRAESKGLNTSPLSLYSQHNITLDQLPALPESGTVSPSSAASPIYPSSPRLTDSVTRLQSSIYPHTPEDLQQYLDDESDEPTPLGGPPEPAAIPAFVGTYSPQPLHQTVIEEATPPAITASQKSTQSASPRSLSPPQLFKPSLSSQHLASPASPILHQPRPQYQSYLTHPEVYPAGLPFHGGVPNDQFYTVPYPSQYPFPMDQSSAHPGEYHQPPAQPNPFFAGYGSPHAAPLPFGSMRNTPAQGHGSTSSGTGLPGEPSTRISQASVPLHGRSIPPDLAGSSGQDVFDDQTNLLHRIQNAIPDLHLLLNRYRETSGQVSVREDTIRRTEAQMAEALRQKEAYIDKLGKELETVSQRHSAESSKFRLEIGNLEEKHKELHDNLDASKKSRGELEVAHRALQSEKALLERKLQGNKETVQRDFDQWKNLATEEFAIKHKRMEDDIQHQSNESRAVVQERVTELTKTHAKEKEVLHTMLLQQIRELEGNHSRLRQDLEVTRKARQRDLEEAQRKELKSREAWDKERDSIVRDFDEERLSLGKGWEEQRRILAAKHQSEKEDLQSTWKSTQTQINERAEGNIARLQREIEKLKTGWDADKARFNKATTELKAVAAKLDNENDNLQRMVEAFGEATDFRSKGDTYL